MSKKLDALLREQTWRGVCTRAISLAAFIVFAIWLPEFAIWMEEVVFKREFVPNDNKVRLLRIAAGIFIFAILIRDISTIRQLLRNHGRDK